MYFVKNNTKSFIEHVVRSKFVRVVASFLYMPEELRLGYFLQSLSHKTNKYKTGIQQSYQYIFVLLIQGT